MAWLILVAALLLHKGYYLAPDVTTGQNIFYVMQGLNALVLYGVIAHLVSPKGWVMLAALVYGAAEQMLVVSCGVFHIGYQFTEAKDLCSASDDWRPYLLGALFLLAWLIWKPNGHDSSRGG